MVNNFLKRTIKSSLFVLALASISQVANAQKVGYMNSSALLAELPEVKQADATIEAFSKQLQKQGQQMVERLQGKYQELDKKQKAGELAPKALDEEAKKLKDEEAKIGAFEQDMQKQIQEKRQSLLQPLFDKVNKAIADVSKEKGFQFVIDSGASVLLFADEAGDVTKFVKEKLGIAATAPAATNK